MADFDRQYQTHAQTGARAEAPAVDKGLRAYMLSVYNYMAAGIGITGLVAYVTFYYAVVHTTAGLQLTEFGTFMFTSPFRWVVMLAPLGMVFYLSARVGHMSLSAAQIAFWVFAGLMGLSLASIFMVYTGESISRVFFITAASFGALSLWGYTTRKDISGWGSFLIMGLIGIIIASIVNIFLGSSALQFAVSVIGVLVFAGLTAYDTQRIKEMYFAGDGAAVIGRKAIMGALSLYLDFINLFLMLLQLFGNRN
jgi:FtsH-binding integral membrane protein